MGQLRKIPAYQGLPSVEEVWLVDSRSRQVRGWRREGTGWPAEPLTLEGSDRFASPVLGGEVGLGRLYRLSGVEA